MRCPTALRRLAAFCVWSSVLPLTTLSTARAQMPPVQLEEMEKVAFLVGNWEGEGWMELGPGERSTFHGTETVESRLGGTVLLIEGLHYEKMSPDEEVPVHHALAVLSYDEREMRYRFDSHLADGRYLNAEGRLVDGAFQWGFRDERGTSIRFTIHSNEEGEWFETGEMSQDGENWRKFFEMTMRRMPGNSS